LAWTIEFAEKAQKDLANLDKSAQRLIVRYIEERIIPSDDPTVFAKPLRHDLAGLWRFRVKDYRVICNIHHDRLVVLVLAIGHRKDIYER
jgi:mRNA interferase RelE/StbE